MIAGIGIDLVSIPDFAIKCQNLAFLRKVFTEAEIEYCQSFQSADEHFAGKFAAKEAFMKAIGKGIQQEIWFSQIEVRNQATGAPTITVYRQALGAIQERQIMHIHLSISHSQEHAVAIVLLESETEIS